MSSLIRLDANELDPHKMIETSAFVLNDRVYEPLIQFYRGELQRLRRCAERRDGLRGRPLAD